MKCERGLRDHGTLWGFTKLSNSVSLVMDGNAKEKKRMLNHEMMLLCQEVVGREYRRGGCINVEGI